MKIEYDAEADALYIDLKDTEAENTEEIEPGVLLDYDKDGAIIGIEILDFKQRVKEAPVQPIIRTVSDGAAVSDHAA